MFVTMDVTVGKGSPLDFILAYGFGILIFVMLVGALAIGFWWIIAGVKDRIIARQGKSRVSYIAGVTVISALFALALWVTTNPIK